MDQSDPLVIAVQEVSAVAAELREVKKRADQYGQASARLQEVSGALEHLARAVMGMQAQFHDLLAKAAFVIGGIDQARLAADATAKSIPEMVARIEATDVSKHVGAFSQSLESVNARIAAQVSSIEHMQVVLEQERDQQRKMFDDIAARSERMASDIAFLRGAAEARTNHPDPLAGQLNEVRQLLTGLTEPMAATRTASDKAANAAAVFGHKGFQAVAELAKKVEALQSGIEAQNKVLTAIKDKRGFVF